MKKDKRFDNITCEFGSLNLDSDRFMKTLVAEMHGRMSDLELRTGHRLVGCADICISYVEAGGDTIAS